MKNFGVSLLLWLTIAFFTPAEATVNGIVTGKVINEVTRQPLPYTSVGFVNLPVGTVTDGEGNFSLALPAGYTKPRLRFSALGFKAYEAPVAALLKPDPDKPELAVTLTPQPPRPTGNNVKVKTGSLKEAGGKAGPFSVGQFAFTLGNRPLKENLGSEIGIRIKVDNQPALLHQVHFYLAENNFQQVKLRIKVYNLRNNLPYQDLLTQNVMFEVPARQTGWMKADLSKYNLTLKADFVVALEWVDYKTNQQQGTLQLSAAKPARHTVYHKEASQDNWEKINAASTGLFVSLRQP